MAMYIADVHSQQAIVTAPAVAEYRSTMVLLTHCCSAMKPEASGTADTLKAGTFWLIYILPGILQGAGLYGLTELIDNDSRQYLLLAACIAVIITPVAHHLTTTPKFRLPSLVLSVGLGLVCAGLAYWSVLRYVGYGTDINLTPSFVAIVVHCCVLIPFITLPFYQTIVIEKHGIGHYELLFRHAWSVCICLLIALFFMLVVWLLTLLSVSLFGILGFSIMDFVFSSSFLLPLMGGAVGAAIGICRERESIIHSTRHILLSLFQILLPFFTAITTVFLVLALVTGINEIETSFSVTLILLLSVALAVLLTNATIRDDSSPVQGYLALAVRVQTMILPFLSVLAIYGLWIRIGDYGLTHDRVMAMIIAVFAVLYSIAYAIGALSRHMVPIIQKANTVLSLMLVATAIALLTPALDVHRIAVKSQTAALKANDIAIDKFDFRYLRFQSGHAGRTALETLKTDTTLDQIAIAEALDALDLDTQGWKPDSPDQLAMEVNRWINDGSVELWQPTPDPFAETLWSDRNFHSMIKFNCVELEKRCVLVQSNELSDTPFQYVLARETHRNQIMLALYVREEPDNWITPEPFDFLEDEENPLSPEVLTLLFDQLASGKMQTGIVKYRAIQIGNELVVPAGAQVIAD